MQARSESLPERPRAVLPRNGAHRPQPAAVLERCARCRTALQLQAHLGRVDGQSRRLKQGSGFKIQGLGFRG